MVGHDSPKGFRTNGPGHIGAPRRISSLFIFLGRLTAFHNRDFISAMRTMFWVQLGSRGHHRRSIIPIDLLYQLEDRELALHAVSSGFFVCFDY